MDAEEYMQLEAKFYEIWHELDKRLPEPGVFEDIYID